MIIVPGHILPRCPPTTGRRSRQPASIVGPEVPDALLAQLGITPAGTAPAARKLTRPLEPA